MSFEVRRIQQPVGQGGFHSAVINVGAEQFKYIYDCGSLSPSCLKQVVDNWSEPNLHYDWLVISSFDFDHFSGVAILLEAGFTFKQVILPHRLDPSFFRQMLMMLIFEERTNAEIIVFIKIYNILTSRDLSANGIGQVLPANENPDGVGNQSDDDSESEEFEGLVNLDRLARESKEKISERQYRVKGIDWMFRFYSREWNHTSFVDQVFDDSELSDLKELIDGILTKLPKDIPNILKKIAEELSRPVDENASVFAADTAVPTQDATIDKGLKKAKNVTVKKRLTDAFSRKDKKSQAQFGDYNSASLCLYSGPIPSLHYTWTQHFELTRCSSGSYFSIGNQTHKKTRAVGWLGVGDIDFRELNELNQFLQYYSGELRLAGTRMVPHHGSQSNYDEEFANLLLFTQAAPVKTLLWVASANPAHRGYRHPSGIVVHACNRKGKFQLVTEDVGTTLEEIVVANHCDWDCCC